MSRFIRGDVVFDHMGRPGVVTNVDKENHQLSVQKQGDAYEVARRRNFLNGMPTDDREVFNEIMEAVREDTESAKEEVKVLGEKIDELRNDPRKHLVVRYLEAQLGHIMNTHRINPREYKVDIDSIR